MLNFLNNITIKNSSAALSGLLIVLAIGVSATGFIVLKEARGTSQTWKQYESITARKADHLSDLRRRSAMAASLTSSRISFSARTAC